MAQEIPCVKISLQTFSDLTISRIIIRRWSLYTLQSRAQFATGRCPAISAHNIAPIEFRWLCNDYIIPASGTDVRFVSFFCDELYFLFRSYISYDKQSYSFYPCVWYRNIHKNVRLTSSPIWFLKFTQLTLFHRRNVDEIDST